MNRGILYLILAALIYSSISVAIRLLDAGNIPPISQVFLRYIVAFASASLYVYLTRSDIKFKKGKVLLLTLICIIGYSLTNLFFTYGVINTLVSNTLFIFYSFAIITPILGFIILKEKVNSYNILSLILSALALLLLFQPNEFSTWKIGGLFSLLAALSQSFYLIGRKKLTQYSSQTMLFWNTLLGVITIGILSLIFENSYFTSTTGILSMSTQTFLLTFYAGIANFSA
jgi:drug/metabolite transporter (DMT)-like permease